MDFNKDTPRKEVTIQASKFNVIAPYEEGHALTANEANVLNQTLAENIRNNFAGTVKKAVDTAGGDKDAIDVKALQKELNEYMKAYEFGVRRSGGGGSRAMDPIEKRSMELARSKVRAFIKGKGYKISEVPASKITELAQGLLEKTPALKEEAERQLAAEQDVAAESLDLGDLDLKEAA